MTTSGEKISLLIYQDGKQIATESTISGKKRIVIVINNQFTNSPNTTQIASGSGRNSTAGNNAAVDSSNTQQQQSVGAQGTAKNLDIKDYQSEPLHHNGSAKHDEEVTLIINNQINETAGISSATQVASGGAVDSASGTNAAIESSNTKQQHAVGGDESGRAFNRVVDSRQDEDGEPRRDAAPPIWHGPFESGKMVPSRCFDARSRHS